MKLLRWWIALTAAVLLAPSAATAQDPKPPQEPPKPGATKPEPAPAGRGQLPPYWKQLGLSEQQKAQVFAAQSKYRTRIADLERQIKELRAEEQKELAKILTDEQRTKLRELVTSRTPGAGEKPPEKK